MSRLWLALISSARAFLSFMFILCLWGDLGPSIWLSKFFASKKFLFLHFGHSRFVAGMLLNMKSLIPEAAWSTWNIYSQIWVSMLWCSRCQNQISLQSISLNQIPWIFLHDRCEMGVVSVIRVTEKFACMLIQTLFGHGGVNFLKMSSRILSQLSIIPKRMFTSFERTSFISRRRLRLGFRRSQILTTASGTMFKLITMPKPLLQISA